MGNRKRTINDSLLIGVKNCCKPILIVFNNPYSELSTTNVLVFYHQNGDKSSKWHKIDEITIYYKNSKNRQKITKNLKIFINRQNIDKSSEW